MGDPANPKVDQSSYAKGKKHVPSNPVLGSLYACAEREEAGKGGGG